MKLGKIIGLTFLAIAIPYASFWVFTIHEMRAYQTRHPQAYPFTMSKAEFVSQFPFYSRACKYFDYDPYEKPKEDRQIAPSWLVYQGIVRHLWYGLALAFLGGGIITFRRKGWVQPLHYLCVVAFGGALFISVALTRQLFTK